MEKMSCLIAGILSECDYPETAYKRAMGVIQLHRLYSSERLNNACKRALIGDVFSYNRIKNILKNRLDSEPIDISELEKDESHIPEHSNIRGASAYQ